MLEQVFLVRQEVEKYNMFTVIKSLPPQELNLSNIGNRMEFSYQKTYNIFQALLNYLLELVPDLDPKVTKIESIDFDKLSVDKYRLHLVKNAIVFQAFNYGLTSPNPSLEAFSNDHFTSKSTLNRKMSNFRIFLKNFGLKVSNSTLEIKGEEKNIRWMAYFVYWQVYHGLEWPFSFVQEDNIKKVISDADIHFDNPIAGLQLEYLLAISQIRITKRCYIKDMGKFNEVFEDNDIGGPILKPESYTLVPIDALSEENKFVNLFKEVVFEAGETDSDKPINLNFKINSKFYAIVYRFVDFLKERYNDDMSVYHNQRILTNIMTFVTREIIFYYIMSPDSLVRWSHYDDSPEDTKEYTSLYQDIYEFFSNVDPEKYTGVYNAAENIARDLFKVLPSYISTIKESDIIHVKLLADPGNPIEAVISRNIRSLDFAEIVPVTTFENVDVLITTLDIYPTKEELDKYPENLVVMPWDISSTRSDYIYLMIRLNKIYVAKLKAKVDKMKKKRKKAK